MSINKIPPGTRVEIFNRAGDPIASGALLEGFTISLNSQFEPIITDKMPDALTYLGAALARITDGGLAFSGELKQFGMSHWKNTDVAKFQFSLEFGMTYSGLEEVSKPIGRLVRIVMPAESRRLSGMLIPPGPSILEALGEKSASNVLPKDSAPAPDEINVPDGNNYNADDAFLNVKVGSMLFKKIILTNAEPTMIKYSDEDGKPIYGRVALQMQTMFVPTKADICEWFGL